MSDKTLERTTLFLYFLIAILLLLILGTQAYMIFQ